MSAIHIALTFDDSFWAPAYTLMRSICLSTKRKTDLVFHLLHRPLSPEHRADLDKISTEYGAVLRYYPLDQSAVFTRFVETMPESAQWPKVVYARLLLPRLLPDDVERVIYLDCDMMVRRPIEALFEADLAGQPLGAVADSISPFIAGRRDMRQNAGIFDPADPYFNSGMLVIDRAGWAALDMEAEIATLAQKGWMERLYYDQDMLNLIFAGRWTPLNWRWNCIDAHPAHEALNPAILHYTGVNKPWFLLAGILRTSAYARWYRHVMTNELFYRFARHRWKRTWLRRLGLRR